MTDSKFSNAFDNLMALEGGKTTDHAGATNYGITLRNLVQVGDMDFDKDHDGDLDKKDLWAFTRDDAREYVWRHWYSNLGLDEILSPFVASKALDIIYNCGVPRGVKIIQEAANRSGGTVLKVDGKLGPKTLRALNSINDAALLTALRAEQRRWYLYLIRIDPRTYKKYEAGWLARART
jgi:lysozyme family protein